MILTRFATATSIAHRWPLLALVCWLIATPSRADMIYWRDATGVQRADLSTASPVAEVLVSGQNRPNSYSEVAIDVAGNRMYWADNIDLRRSALDGTGVTNVVTGNPNASMFLHGITLTAQHDAVFATHIGPSSAASILATSVGGTSFGYVKPSGLVANGLEIDPSTNKLYWARQGALVANVMQPGAVMFGASDSSPPSTLFANLVSVMDVAVDSLSGKIYWTDLGTDKIQRGNLDGSGAIEDLISTGLTGPTGIALDLEHGKFYWADSSRNVIERANLDGTHREVVLSGLNRPLGIALDFSGDVFFAPFATAALVPEPTGAALGIVGSALLLLFGRRFLRPNGRPA